MDDLGESLRNHFVARTTARLFRSRLSQYEGGPVHEAESRDRDMLSPQIERAVVPGLVTC